MIRNVRYVLIALILVLAVGIATAQETPTAPTAERLIPQVIATFPHDPTSYTQGLVLHEGFFYESAGKYGQSRLLKVDPATGETVQEQRLSDQFFAEGLALIDDRLVQLTWQEGYAFFWDLESFTPLGLYFYTGEGWGLCYDGEFLYMSDGSQFLYQRDPVTFRLLNQWEVTLNGEPIAKINELECVEDLIYANVYQTDTLLRIEKTSGVVTGEIDASQLLTQEERDRIIGADSGAVLNGIAYDPENEVFYLTGKLWEKVFEVTFVPED